MKNSDKWKPNKFVFRKGKLTASRDPHEVGIGSRLVADIVAEAYETNLPKHAKGNLLDLGCGKVPFYILYKNYITNNICVDWENTAHKNDYLDYECNLNEVLPFEEEEFDTIILSDVLEHIPKPEQLWDEMYRVLSKGGRVIMNVPYYYWLHEQPHDYYRYTEFALRRFVKNSGMKLIQLDSLGGAPVILADVFAKSVIRVMRKRIGHPLAKFTQWLTMAFIRTKFGKTVSEKTKYSFPIGYFLVAEKPE